MSGDTRDKKTCIWLSLRFRLDHETWAARVLHRIGIGGQRMPAIYMCDEASHARFRVGNNIKFTDRSGSQSHITRIVRYSVMNPNKQQSFNSRLFKYIVIRSPISFIHKRLQFKGVRRLCRSAETVEQTLVLSYFQRLSPFLCLCLECRKQFRV